VRIVTHPEAGRKSFARPRRRRIAGPVLRVEIFEIVRVDLVVFNERAVAVGV
jgi:hypothetical protein